MHSYHSVNIVSHVLSDQELHITRNRPNSNVGVTESQMGIFTTSEYISYYLAHHTYVSRNM